MSQLNLRRLWSRHLIPFALMAALVPYSFAQTPVSQGKPVVASSQEGNLSPAAVVDGNTATRWASNYADAEWVYIDLGVKTTLSRVLLNWEAAYGKAYQIQVSDNASSWTTIYSTTTGDGGIDDFNVSGAGRYVRLNGVTRGTGWGYSLWEFQVFGSGGTVGDSLISTGARAVASSQQGDLLAGLAVDGNASTRWGSNFNDAEWIYLDLGTSSSISRVVLQWEAAYGKNYQLQTSADAVTWNTVFSTTTGDGGVDDITLSGTGRYVRLNGTARGTGWGYSLWEFQVYGTKNSNGPVVQVFQHCNYQGWSVSFPVGAYTANDIKALGGLIDDASSVKVSAGYEAVLFQHDNYVGSSVRLTGDTACLTNYNYDQMLSSLKVQTATPPEGNPTAAACVYEHPQFAGGVLCLNPGNYNLPLGWQKNISSLQLSAGYKIQLFDQAGQQGQSVTVSGNNADLTSVNFDNQAASFSITRTAATCNTGENCTLIPDVTDVVITNIKGGAPAKGDAMIVTLTLNNTAGQTGWVRVTPYLTSSRFSDYSDVQLTSAYVKLNATGSTQVAVQVDPFITDLAKQKRYAVGHGDYQINRVTLINANNQEVSDTTYNGKNFKVNKTSAVFPAVVYDENYFSGIKYTKTPAVYVNEVMTRTSELYNPANSSYQFFAGGFDEMLGIRHVSQPVPGFKFSSTANIGSCEQATAYVEKAIGITAGTWGGGVKTSLNHHGFDYAIAYTPDTGGGVACGWINVQVSSYINRDLDRQQVVSVHESGHIFGAPHCEGSSGYVMCSGEVHDHYIRLGYFVWLQESRNSMANRFD